jgi:hypothetical protein
MVLPALLLHTEPQDWQGMHVDGTPPDGASGGGDSDRATTRIAREEENETTGTASGAGDEQRQSLVPSSAVGGGGGGVAASAAAVAAATAAGHFYDGDDGHLTFCDVLRMREFWSLAVTNAVLNIFWSGFNIHAVVIMAELAQFSVRSWRSWSR